MKTRCLVVDDEPLAIKLIVNHISQLDSLEVVATCNSALEAFEILNNEEIDLLFLDIKMPKVTGLEFLRTLRNPPKTILTTAYRDFAIESYELGVVDYLLKPITFPRFFKAVERFLRDKEENNKSIAPKQSNNSPEYIIIKSGTKHHKINTSDILYVESLKDYIQIYTSPENRIVSKYKIGDIENELPTDSFLRVHRSYIINSKKVSAFTVHDIELGKIEIPIGTSYKKEVSTFLQSLMK